MITLPRPTRQVVPKPTREVVRRHSAWPSGLAQGPVGWAQIVNYAVFGILLLVFFSGLRSQFLQANESSQSSVPW
jgi:hypothetical protein